jgi:hypothetical protein
MSLSSSQQSLPYGFQLVLTSFLQATGLPFCKVLTAEHIDRVFAEEGAMFGTENKAIYTPSVTLWAFLSQFLFPGEGRSCKAAVFRTMVMLFGLSRPVGELNTGAYSRARGNLSVVVIRRLAIDVAQGCEQQVPTEWLWHGRHVKLVDGTTVSMPDTPENQERWPQPNSQKEGLGFPLARMVVLLSMVTAMVCAMEMGPYAGKGTGETALFRQLLDSLAAGDIVVADRFYCSYMMIALVLGNGGDIVTRQHQGRMHFRRICRLGKQDYLVEWTRSARPTWMDRETYALIPETLTLRQVTVEVKQRGFRVKSLTVVTTLTDAQEYSREAIAELYQRRWLAEVDIRAIKKTMGLDVLRCKSPEMVEKELWGGFLAYNLIRQTMLQSASTYGLSPRQMSFTSALAAVAGSYPSLPLLVNPRQVIDWLMPSRCWPVVGNRPGRVEPRKVKRRSRALGYLTKPRAEARAERMAGLLA